MLQKVAKNSQRIVFIACHICINLFILLISVIYIINEVNLILNKIFGYDNT